MTSSEEPKQKYLFKMFETYAATAKASMLIFIDRDYAVAAFFAGAYSAQRYVLDRPLTKKTDANENKMVRAGVYIDVMSEGKSHLAPSFWEMVRQCFNDGYICYLLFFNSYCRDDDTTFDKLIHFFTVIEWETDTFEPFSKKPAPPKPNGTATH